MKKICFEKALLRAALGLLVVPAMVLATVTKERRHAIPDDSIGVTGHLALANASVTSVKTSKHWRREYLELQDSAHRMVTLVDVTDATHPVIVKQLHLPAGAADSTLTVLVGDVGLLRGTGTQPPNAQARPVSVVSFADPNHPKTVRKFSNVSAFQTDEGRGLIYLVNKQGLWILRQKPAPDEELEQEYAKQVLYDH
jgi:hypothetical protein